MRVEYTPIRNYISFEDLLEKSGYKQRHKRIGLLGEALIKANRKAKLAWLRRQLNKLFEKLRKAKHA